MPKKDIPKTMSGFDLKGYMKQESNTSETKSSNIEEKTEPKAKSRTQETIKTPEKKTAAPAEEKIAFMNYLPVDLHDEFSLIFLKAKQELRGRTKKALSQTELVEAILRYAVKGWGERKDDILEIAEEIINSRRTKE